MVTRLPPAEKLPLALRKNIRDEWENKKEGLEKELSDILGVPWSLKEINPNAVWPYAGDGYGKESLGSCLAGYINGLIYQLKSFESTYGEEGVKELNGICHEHSVLFDIDVDKKVSYCGVDVVDGKLRLLFAENCLGTNIDYAAERDKLAAALNAAPPAPGSDSKLSYAARSDIRQNYDGQIEETRKKIADMLENPEFKLNPNWDAVYAKLAEAASQKKPEVREDWQSCIGNMMRLYFEGAAYQMNYQKFGEDEMMREAFNEAVEKGEISFRIVDTMKYDTYGEVVIEDGVCWLQCQPKNFGTNVDYAAQKLVDQL